MNTKIIATIISLFFAHIVSGQIFKELMDTGLMQVQNSACAVEDINCDGLPDIVLTGLGLSNTKIYLNKGNNRFKEDLTTSDIASFEFGDIDFVDYDNDGDLDLVLDGRLSYYAYPTPNFWRNDGNGKFTVQKAMSFNFGDFTYFDLADCDNDGDLDIISNTAGLNVNNGLNNFYKIENNLLNASNYVEWGDYDKDGDLDILNTMYGDNASANSRILVNQGNYNFQIDTLNKFESIELGVGKWGDFNNDGYPDVFLAGHNSSKGISSLKIYQNNHSNFQELANFKETGLASSMIELGDIDNDGWLDFIVTGVGDKDVETRVYKNINGERFEKLAGEKIQGVERGSLKLRDIDNDLDLDLVITGGGEHDYSSGYRKRITKIYINKTSNPNHKPEPPLNLKAVVDKTTVHLNWSSSIDTETPAKGMGYAVELVRGMSNRIISSVSYIGGRNIKDTSLIINNLEPGVHYWKVRSIDNGLLSSEFSAIDSFFVGDSIPVIDHYPKFPTVASNDDSLTFVVKNIGKGILEIESSTSQGEWFTFTKKAFTDSIVFIVKFEKNTGAIRHGQIQLNSGNSLNSPYFLKFSQNGTPVFLKEATLPTEELTYNSIAIGDYDNDNDMDLFLTGYDSYSNPATNLFQNTINGYVKSNTYNFPDNTFGGTLWFDYDNDGDLDLVIGGIENNTDGFSRTKIFRNLSNGQFVEDTASVLKGNRYGSIDFGDLNNDGFYDLIESEESEQGIFTKFFLNKHGNSLLESFQIITEVPWNSSGVFDYDNDMDMDFMMTNRLYHNNGNNAFTLTLKTVYGIMTSSYADLNNDGFMDICWGGRVFLNDGKGHFAEKKSTGLKVDVNYMSWGDYDNDGDLDVVEKLGENTYLFNNNGKAEFSCQEGEIFTQLIGPVKFLDFNNDNKLDIILTGINKVGQVYAELYTNNYFKKNTPPVPPSSMSTNVVIDTTYIGWSQGFDAESPADGLNYNLYFYKVGGDTLLNSMSDHKTGILRMPFWGNAQTNTGWKIKIDSPGKYRWAVQTIDQGYLGSKFSSEKEFEVKPALMFDAVMENAKWQVGKDYYIRWKQAFIDFVKLEYSIDNKTWVTISESVDAKEQKFKWITPDIITDKCYLRILNSENNLQDTLSIELIPFVEIINPMENSGLMVTDSVDIKWNSKYTDSLIIEYRFDNSLKWSPIAKIMENQVNSFRWKIPSDSLGMFWLKISDMNVIETTDSVKLEFISYLKLLSPARSKQILPGNKLQIKWSSFFVDEVELYFYSSKYDFFSGIYFNNQQNQDYFEWTVPSYFWEDSCQVFIRDKNSAAKDSSGYFYLVNKLTLSDDFASNKLNISVYPNPVTDYLHLVIHDTGNKEFILKLLNENGITVIEKEIFQKDFVLNVDQIPKGIYFLEVSTNKTKVYKKIVVL